MLQFENINLLLHFRMPAIDSYVVFELDIIIDANLLSVVILKVKFNCETPNIPHLLSTFAFTNGLKHKPTGSVNVTLTLM